MGLKRFTHAPEEMKELKDITLNQKFIKGEGNERQMKIFKNLNDLINKNKIKKIKAVVACGNGTLAYLHRYIKRMVVKL